MHLIFPPEAENLDYAKLGEEAGKKKVWIFPDIEQTFSSVKLSNGEIIIDPSYYYITSGEALRKTEVMISDIKDAIEKHNGNDIVVEQLECLLDDIQEFYELLKYTKDSSLYLEVTKCEDGIYNRNICARKDPKKKKKDIKK